MDLTEEQWKVLEMVALRGEIIGSLPLEGLAGSPRISRGVAGGIYASPKLPSSDGSATRRHQCSARRRVAHPPYCTFFAAAWRCNFCKRFCCVRIIAVDTG